MDKIPTVRDIIDLWPSRAALVEDICTADDPVTLETVHKWAQRQSIPSRYHAAVLRASTRRSLALTAETIVAAHDPALSSPPSTEDAA